MQTPLQHLIEHDYAEAIEPPVQRGRLSDMMRKPRSLRDEVDSKAMAAAALFHAGMDVTLDEEEEKVAGAVFQNEIRQLPIKPAGLANTAVVLKLSALLSEYDHEIVHEAAQMRKYVTNRLLEESDPKSKNPTAQRIAALKLLGQITEVGLFTERTEITVKTMPTETIEAQLYEKLRVLLPEEVEEIKQEQSDAA
jgi:hypothetical protein